ncbi:MAG: dUTP diphosphatase [Oscillospiraceae bacterium]|nr:dUTP diphosphatase [Oscillospiraceae bacterium]
MTTAHTCRSAHTVPTRGLDLRTPRAFTVYPNGSAVIDTGVHVELPPNTVGMLKSKSGLNVKRGITTEGVIDVGYAGSIVAKLYNHGKKPIKFAAGQKITQLVIMPAIIPAELEVVEHFKETERGANGFGSTGK